MKFVTYCEEPYFFMKIYNTISEEKRFEFETKLNDFKKVFSEYYDSKLFNPRISFTDGFILISQDKETIAQIDLRDELRKKIIFDEELVDEILTEFNTSHGLHVCDKQEQQEQFPYIIDHKIICDKIEESIN